MGQTQLFLVVLGMMLVGIAIYVGVGLFSANTVENTRNAIIVDLGNFAARANAYYWKPTSQGGGGNSFANITLSQVYPMAENPNARYYIESAQDDQCVIERRWESDHDKRRLHPGPDPRDDRSEHR